MITQETADDISFRCIASLRDGFRQRVEAWFAECRKAGLNLYIYEGLRTSKRQAELYARGRTAPGRKVTNAGPGQSFHNYGLAIDFVPLVAKDRPGFFEAGWTKEKIYKVAQSIAAKHQLRALSWETPHLEDATLPNWQAAKRKYGTPA